MPYIVKADELDRFESVAHRVDNLDDASKKTNNGRFADECYPSANAVMDKLGNLDNLDLNSFANIVSPTEDEIKDPDKLNNFFEENLTVAYDEIRSSERNSPTIGKTYYIKRKNERYYSEFGTYNGQENFFSEIEKGTKIAERLIDPKRWRNYKLIYLPMGTYNITKPITMIGKYVKFRCDGTIVYDGPDCAVRVHCESSDIHINQIQVKNTNAIGLDMTPYFYSDASKGDEYYYYKDNENDTEVNTTKLRAISASKPSHNNVHVDFIESYTHSGLTQEFNVEDVNVIYKLSTPQNAPITPKSVKINDSKIEDTDHTLNYVTGELKFKSNGTYKVTYSVKILPAIGIRLYIPNIPRAKGSDAAGMTHNSISGKNIRGKYKGVSTDCQEPSGYINFIRYNFQCIRGATIGIDSNSESYSNCELTADTRQSLGADAGTNYCVYEYSGIENLQGQPKLTIPKVASYTYNVPNKDPRTDTNIESKYKRLINDLFRPYDRNDANKQYNNNSWNNDDIGSDNLTFTEQCTKNNVNYNIYDSAESTNIASIAYEIARRTTFQERLEYIRNLDDERFYNTYYTSGTEDYNQSKTNFGSKTHYITEFGFINKQMLESVAKYLYLEDDIVKMKDLLTEEWTDTDPNGWTGVRNKHSPISELLNNIGVSAAHNIRVAYYGNCMNFHNVNYITTQYLRAYPGESADIGKLFAFKGNVSYANLHTVTLQLDETYITAINECIDNTIHGPYIRNRQIQIKSPLKFENGVFICEPEDKSICYNISKSILFKANYALIDGTTKAVYYNGEWKSKDDGDYITYDGKDTKAYKVYNIVSSSFNHVIPHNIEFDNSCSGIYIRLDDSFDFTNIPIVIHTRDKNNPVGLIDSTYNVITKLEDIQEFKTLQLTWLGKSSYNKTALKLYEVTSFTQIENGGTKLSLPKTAVPATQLSKDKYFVLYAPDYGFLGVDSNWGADKGIEYINNTDSENNANSVELINDAQVFKYCVGTDDGGRPYMYACTYNTDADGYENDSKDKPVAGPTKLKILDSIRFLFDENRRIFYNTSESGSSGILEIELENNNVKFIRSEHPDKSDSGCWGIHSVEDQPPYTRNEIDDKVEAVENHIDEVAKDILTEDDVISTVNDSISDGILNNTLNSMIPGIADSHIHMDIINGWRVIRYSDTYTEYIKVITLTGGALNDDGVYGCGETNYLPETLSGYKTILVSPSEPVAAYVKFEDNSQFILGYVSHSQYDSVDMTVIIKVIN